MRRYMGWWGDFVARLLEKGVHLGYMRVFTHAFKNHILNQVKKYNISIINNSLETLLIKSSSRARSTSRQ